jgi:V/A-type H+-transporting ATPase subunit I
MTKVMIVCHRSQVSDLLEAIQSAGICQLLNAEEAIVARDVPDLVTAAERPRDTEEMVARLDKAIRFLNTYTEPEKGLAHLLAPRKQIDRRAYDEVVCDADLLKVVEECVRLESAKDKTADEIESIQATLEALLPWAAMETPVEELGRLQTSTSWAGLIPGQHYEALRDQLFEHGAALQEVGTTGTRQACIIVALRENTEPIQKLLRAHEFEAVNFEGMTGTVSELIREHERKLNEAHRSLERFDKEAALLAGNVLKLQILHDHYTNLLAREQAGGLAPATEQAVIFEAWVREQDYARLETILGQFDAASVGRTQIAPGEETPVEIENPDRVRPFEVITRLYGMPHPTDVDPTAFLAPFFALFFGICLTDAVYGLVLVGFMWWFLKKIGGEAKFFKMMLICAVPAVVAGALTGGWCGDAIQVFVPALGGFREALMWFDPLEKPMNFFNISLALGYFQIIFGVGLAFWNKWRRGGRLEAVLDHGTWFVWLNSLTIVGLAEAGVLPEALSTVFAIVAVVPALGIMLFSEREGNWGARIGMGFYNVFSTVFYVGDVLSYIRLMALGMVTAGFGMAINSIVKQVMDLGVLGWILGAVIFVGGHLFNIANSSLSAFVHTMRLQFVEFFTKFLQGGGKQFEPLRKEYKHIQVDE